MDSVLASPVGGSDPALDTRLHPLVAIRATRALLRDPSDTRQVFIVLLALRGRSVTRNFGRFAAGPVGAAILRDRPDLLARLADLGALGGMAEGSLGRLYARFMGAQGLAADGLVAAQEAGGGALQAEDMEFFRHRMRDQHDLLHVVTGYGAEPAGELCLLAFTFAQMGHAGMALMAFLGCMKGGFGAPGRRLWRAVGEAWLHGRRAAWLGATDWEGSMGVSVETLRAQWRVRAPVAYRGVVA